MKISKLIVAMSLAGLSQSYIAFADDEASFTVHMPLMSYLNTSVSTKEGTVTTKEKIEEGRTADLTASFVEATWGKANLYVYPFYDSKLMSVSYLPIETLEVGLDLGFNSWKRPDPEHSTTDSNYGVWGIYYLNLSKALIIENGLNFNMIASSSKLAATATTEAGKTDKAEMATRLTINAVYALSKNLNYVGGIWYVMDKEDNKVEKIKKDTGSFGVNIATVRMVLK